MVNDILDIKKVESGFLGLRREPLTPAELISSTCDGMLGMADELQVTFKQVVEKNEPFFGDKDRLIQILTNYMSNALKHSPKGCHVEIKSSVGLITANNVRFSVIDDGPGIAQENLDKLFGMFQQLSPSSTNHGVKGSGLGLALTKSLVELHGGKVGCSSKVGEGACFWFEVPSGSGPEISF
jgi:signal transduction histidine kinase